MEGRIDIFKLISEIHLRPALWDIKNKDYNDRIKRKKGWEEIVNCFADQEKGIEDKKKLCELLHKKWKNIRDRFARYIKSRKLESGDGAQTKSYYVYEKQLEFLKDTVGSVPIVNSLKPIRNRKRSLRNHENEPSTSAAPKIVQKIGKKKLRPTQDKFLNSLEKCKKGVDTAKLDDDNRHFLLSLLPALSSLPRRLNTYCRIEMMQLLAKFETYASQQYEQPQQNSGVQQVQLHQTPLQTLQLLHTSIPVSSSDQAFIPTPSPVQVSIPTQSPVESPKLLSSPAESNASSISSLNSDDS